jgi:type I restriction enzyme, S subunit
MTWKVYSEYKESGIEWLRQIPAHWEISTLRRIGRFSASGIDKKSVEGEMSVHMVNYTNIYGNKTFEINSSNNLMETTAPMEKLKEHQILCGDIMFTPSSETTEEIGLSAVVMENIEKTVYSYHVIRFRTTVVLDLRFKKYFCNHPFIWSQFSRASKGTTRQILTREDFKNIVALIPPFDEQRAIANFLDRETERIDTLIAKKERQIELLLEKRAALISCAVTKGLNPNVKMKDSGIQWLGMIPEHWTITRFKYALWLQRGHDLPATDFRDGVYPVCGSNGCIGYHDHFTTKGPGVTVGRSGSVGEVNYVDRDYWAHNTALYVKEFRRTRPKYAFYLLKALDVKYLSEGSAVGTLNRNYIHDLPVAIPSISEQYAIVGFLDRETVQLQELIEKIRTSIQALSEYRTALISAAGTGKIDVREEVP